MIPSRPRFAAYDIGGPQLPRTSARVLVQQLRVARRPDRGPRRASSRQIASVSRQASDEPRPAGDAVAARERELRIGEPCSPAARDARDDARASADSAAGSPRLMARSRSLA